MACGCGPPRVPTFNLTLNLWRGIGATIPPMGAKLASYSCQLSPGERTIPTAAVLYAMYLSLPKGTDIRGFIFGTGDVVEVPAGTARYYRVEFVDDVGKGFSNEYRFAVINQGAPWPGPTP